MERQQGFRQCTSLGLRVVVCGAALASLSGIFSEHTLLAMLALGFEELSANEDPDLVLDKV